MEEKIVSLRVMYLPSAYGAMDGARGNGEELRFFKAEDEKYVDVPFEEVPYEVVHEQEAYAGDNPPQSCEIIWKIFNLSSFCSDKGIRSMMMGDIVELDGVKYITCPFGFKKVG